VTLASLRILDALADPEPETPADLQRERELKESSRSTAMKLGNTTMKVRFASLAGFVLASALPQLGHAQGYIQIPIPGIPGVGPAPPPQEREYRGWREHCDRLRDREHELRNRLAYTPPYSEERGKLEHRLAEVHYEREQCWHR
jgi:hypothetical protein